MQLLDEFEDGLDITSYGTPSVTGYFEVEVEGEVVHSKKNGDGYVDSNAKLQKIIKRIYDMKDTK